jgi:hypothetical protein
VVENQAFENYILEKFSGSKADTDLYQVDHELESGGVQPIFFRIMAQTTMVYSPICPSDRISASKILQTLADGNTKLFGVKLIHGEYVLAGLFPIDQLMADEEEIELAFALPHLAFAAKSELGFVK